MTNRSDLRVTKTVRAIRAAAEQMICEMSFAKITVQEIEQRAQIHRKTFYHHYASLDDLFNEIVLDIENNFYEALKQSAPDMTLEEINGVFFHSMDRQENYAMKILLDPSYSQVADKVLEDTLAHNLEINNPYGDLPQWKQEIVMAYLAVVSHSIFRQGKTGGNRGNHRPDKSSDEQRTIGPCITLNRYALPQNKPLAIIFELHPHLLDGVLYRLTNGVILYAERNTIKNN